MVWKSGLTNHFLKFIHRTSKESAYSKASGRTHFFPLLLAFFFYSKAGTSLKSIIHSSTLSAVNPPSFGHSNRRRDESCVAVYGRPAEKGQFPLSQSVNNSVPQPALFLHKYTLTSVTLNNQIHQVDNSAFPKYYTVSISNLEHLHVPFQTMLWQWVKRNIKLITFISELNSAQFKADHVPAHM